MHNILSELYHGNITPSESAYIKGKDYKKAARQVCDIEESLLSQLDDGGKELYSQLPFAIIERDSIENAQIFTDAFRLGANIMLACFCRTET